LSDIAEPIPGIPLNKTPHPFTGYALYLSAALLFALNGTVSKSILLTGIDPARLSQLRVTGAFLVLLVYVALRNPTALRLTKKEIPIMLAYGILGVAGTQYLYFVALTYLPVSIALLIEFTAPVMIALWFRFVWKEPTKKSVWVALGMALAGLALVAQVWLGFAVNAVGVLAALAAAVSLSIFYLLGDRQLRVVNPRDPVSLTMWGFAAASLFWLVAQPWWAFPWDALSGNSEPLSDANLSFPIWVMAMWMILLGTVITFSLVLASMRHLRASQASTVGLTEPLFATMIAWILLGEALSTTQVIGGALILFGVFIAERARLTT
jgi:drug/metabolite transporter (DMT)-like permease